MLSLERSPMEAKGARPTGPPTLSLKLLATLADQSPRSAVPHSPDFLSSPHIEGGDNDTALRNARAANAELHRAKERLQQELASLREELHSVRGSNANASHERWGFAANVRSGRGTARVRRGGSGSDGAKASSSSDSGATPARAKHSELPENYPSDCLLGAVVAAANANTDNSSDDGGGFSNSMPAPAARSRLGTDGGSISPPSSFGFGCYSGGVDTSGTGLAGDCGQQHHVLRREHVRLLLMRHASKCSTPAGELCRATPHCASLKALWEHLSHCRNPGCETPQCVSTRDILTHYQRCCETNERCVICGPVRAAIRRHFERASSGQAPERKLGMSNPFGNSGSSSGSGSGSGGGGGGSSSSSSSSNNNSSQSSGGGSNSSSNSDSDDADGVTRRFQC